MTYIPDLTERYPEGFNPPNHEYLPRELERRKEREDFFLSKVYEKTLSAIRIPPSTEALEDVKKLDAIKITQENYYRDQETYAKEKVDFLKKVAMRYGTTLSCYDEDVCKKLALPKKEETKPDSFALRFEYNDYGHVYYLYINNLKKENFLKAHADVSINLWSHIEYVTPKGESKYISNIRDNAELQLHELNSWGVPDVKTYEDIIIDKCEESFIPSFDCKTSEMKAFYEKHCMAFISDALQKDAKALNNMKVRDTWKACENAWIDKLKSHIKQTEFQVGDTVRANDYWCCAVDFVIESIDANKAVLVCEDEKETFDVCMNFDGRTYLQNKDAEGYTNKVYADKVISRAKAANAVAANLPMPKDKGNCDFNKADTPLDGTSQSKKKFPHMNEKRESADKDR